MSDTYPSFRTVRPPEDQVREFHDAFDLPRADTPTVPSLEQRRRRLSIMIEEFGELAGALLSDSDESYYMIADLAEQFREHAHRALPDYLTPVDLAAVLDALGDIAYTNAGTAVVTGLPLSEALRVIHEANMAKLWENEDGTKSPRVNEHGKVIKPPKWQGPDIAAVLAADVVHHVVRVQGDRWGLEAQVECRAPVGAECRLGCALPGCDWEDGPPHVDDDGNDHGTKDVGRCLAVEWVNAEDAKDLHHPDVPNEPLHDGMPVELTWNGDGYYWSGIGALPAATTPERVA